MRKKWIKILTFLPLILAILAVAFMDEKIPIHYDSAGNVDRWGSRYEIFILPLATFLMSGFLLWMQKFAAKQEDYGDNNEKYIDLTIISCLIIFNVINILIIYGGLVKLESLNLKSFSVLRLIIALSGALFIVLGNKLPKVKRNSLVGLRTKWSMANDLVWKKSQKFAGLVFIIMGLISIIVSMLANTKSLLIYYLAFIILSAIVMVIGSYIIYKKTEKIKNK